MTRELLILAVVITGVNMLRGGFAHRAWSAVLFCFCIIVLAVSAIANQP